MTMTTMHTNMKSGTKILLAGVTLMVSGFLFVQQAYALSDAGPLISVPPDHALTAIGYGSDDRKCWIGMKTAPLRPDKTINTSLISGWRHFRCSDGGGDHSGREATAPSGSAVTGWTWGVFGDTGGGGNPRNFDGSPTNECYYQEYMNLRTGKVFPWGSEFDGTCSGSEHPSPGEKLGRGYQESWLKKVARAPAGEVIVAVSLNLDKDAKVGWVSASTRALQPLCGAAQVHHANAHTCPNVSGWIRVAPGNSGQPGSATLACTAPCNPDLHWRNTTGVSVTGKVMRGSVVVNSAADGDLWDQNANLGVGTHKYKFQIRDKFGALFTVDEATVTVNPGEEKGCAT